MSKQDKKLSLIIGCPPPSYYMYAPDMIKCLFEYTEEEAKEEFKKANERMKMAWDSYHKNRKKELKELDKILEEEKND